MGPEILLVLLAMWMVAAPDGASLALSRGAAGAVRAGFGAGRGAARAHRAAHPRAVGGGRSGRGNWVSGRGATVAIPVAGGRRGRGRTGRGRTTGAGIAQAVPVAASTAPTAPVGPVPSPLWPVLSAAVPAAVNGARAAVAAARKRRAAGTDRTSRAVRALRQGLAVAAAGLSGARTAGGGLRARVRVGMDAAHTRRAAQRSQEAIDGQEPQEATDDTQDTPAGQAGTGENAQDTTERAESTSAPAQNTTPEETPVSTTPNTITAAVGGTELATLADLRAEIGDVDTRITEAAELLSVVTDWAATLPERYVAAPFGTDGLNTAVVAAAEALASIPNLDDLVELLATVVNETAKAEALGEVADELGATGDVGAFRAA